MFKAYTGYPDATFSRLHIIYFTIFKFLCTVFKFFGFWSPSQRLFGARSVLPKASLRVTLARLANIWMNTTQCLADLRFTFYYFQKWYLKTKVMSLMGRNLRWKRNPKFKMTWKTSLQTPALGHSLHHFQTINIPNLKSRQPVIDGDYHFQVFQNDARNNLPSNKSSLLYSSVYPLKSDFWFGRTI